MTGAFLTCTFRKRATINKAFTWVQWGKKETAHNDTWLAERFYCRRHPLNTASDSGESGNPGKKDDHIFKSHLTLSYAKEKDSPALSAGLQVSVVWAQSYCNSCYCNSAGLVQHTGEQGGKKDKKGKKNMLRVKPCATSSMSSMSSLNRLVCQPKK